MPINQSQSNKELRRLLRDGQIPLTKPELLGVFNAILAIWEGNQYRNGISNAIEGAYPGLTNPQKRALHEAAMRVAIREGLL